MSTGSVQRMGAVAWLICIIAAIGFAFDIYELLMLPLIIKPAMQELAGYAPGSDGFVFWASLMFYLPALFGGLFGVLGGWLTDRFGRRRILTWSILLYAFSAFFAGYSTSLTMLLILRCTTFIGVCVEFVAAVAWLAELFDDPHRREKVLGYTQAFSSIGGLLVAIVFGLLSTHSANLPAIVLPDFLTNMLGAIKDPHAPWRYTLMSGLIPAIPLILIRPFLPESPKWAAKRAEGTLKRPSIAALFSPEFRRTTIVTTLMFACSYGVAFGAIQQLQQIVPGIDEVKTKIATATEGKPEAAVKPLQGRMQGEMVANYTKSQETGGLVGRFVLALIVTWFASRANLLRFFLWPGLIVLPIAFWMFAQGQETTFASYEVTWMPGFHDFSLSVLGLCIFLAGFFTVAQFSFWGNYLPHVYPVHLRGTGESFAANIGGRMLGTMFFAVTQNVATLSFVPGATPPAKIAYVAMAVAFLLYLANLILSFWLPEPTENISAGE